jgi:transcriptional regulator with XRE-family HTH domain
MAYPKALTFVGDHLRKRRLDLKIFQKDVGKLLGVTTSSVTNWEKNRVRPSLRYIPRIISFLGYNPISGTPSNFGQEINLYRRNHGISIKQLAKTLRVDPTTLARWEKGETLPSAATKNRLQGFLSPLKIKIDSSQ